MMETRNDPYSNGEDGISKLPDEIVHHILSSNIDTKHVVQTSVLSKKWKHTWKSVPNLNIDRSSFPEGKEHTQRFISFADMVFILRDDSDIRRFRLRWYSFEHDDQNVANNVERWIVNAVERNVQLVTVEIDQYHHPLAYEIPHQLLNCKSLRKLCITLNDGAEHAQVTLPKSMDLPRLKVLSLAGFSISDVGLSERLFSSCPLLQVLDIYDCDVLNLTVNSLSLEKFACVRLSSIAKNIKLTAPNLKDFFCRTSAPQYFSLENSPLLSNVDFGIMLEQRVSDEDAEVYWKLPIQEKEVYAERMMKFLGAVHMAKQLRLSSGFLEVLSRAPDLLNCQLPPRLCNLKDLKLGMWSTRGCLQAIAYLLKISPNITSLSLQSEESNLMDVGDDWEAGLSSPGMLSHLKSVDIKEVGGCDAELKLLSFLLKHAKVLVEVNLYFRFSTGLPDKVGQVEGFKKKLRAVHTASSNIELVFN